MKKDEILVVCLSGRGDKDVYSVAKYLERYFRRIILKTIFSILSSLAFVLSNGKYLLYYP